MIKQNKKEISQPTFWLPILLMLTVVFWMFSEFAKSYSVRMDNLKGVQNEKQEVGEQMKLTSNTTEPTEPTAPPAPPNRQKFFAENWDACAEEERQRGVPAYIKLAQMSIETEDGTAFLAKQANNYFGIKCFRRNCKKGHCVNRTDDSHKDFFVKYSSKWESIRAHSEFLKNKNYKRCWSCETVECWAKELKAAGYATAPTYEGMLLTRIKQIKQWQKTQ
jgi:flagellum-specific peptidoglycan hydrolase FlgJ